MTFQPRPFQPASWAPGPHAQTLGARLLRTPDGLEYRRERLTTPDGDFLDLDWGPEPGPEAPIVLVMHGLEGSSRRRYVRNVCRELHRRGVQPVALNFRGCSGESNRALHFYHSGQTDDPAFVLERFRERYPGRRLGALGFSLGGNVLIKLMGERPDGGRGLLEAAVAMSVPFDLSAGCALLEESPMGRAYAAYFLRSLRGKLVRKRERLEVAVDIERALVADTLREFDDRLTAPLNGFANAEDYYTQSSSDQFLGHVRVPTLLLHAVDDPFLPEAAIPSSQAGSNDAVTLVLHGRGGHVGFLEGTPWKPAFWADEESARYLAETLAGGVTAPAGNRAGDAAQVPRRP